METGKISSGSYNTHKRGWGGGRNGNRLGWKRTRTPDARRFMPRMPRVECISEDSDTHQERDPAETTQPRRWPKKIRKSTRTTRSQRAPKAERAHVVLVQERLHPRVLRRHQHPKPPPPPAAPHRPRRSRPAPQAAGAIPCQYLCLREVQPGCPPAGGRAASDGEPIGPKGRGVEVGVVALRRERVGGGPLGAARAPGKPLHLGEEDP